MSGAALKSSARSWEPALTEANRVRCARAAYCHQMAAAPVARSRALAAAALHETPDVLASMPVAAFLARVRRVTPRTAERLCAQAGCSASRPLRELTVRQRHVLAAALYNGGSDA